MKIVVFWLKFHWNMFSGSNWQYFSIQIMAWHWTGDKPLSEPMMAEFGNAYMHLSAWMIQKINHSTGSVTVKQSAGQCVSFNVMWSKAWLNGELILFIILSRLYISMQMLCFVMIHNLWDVNPGWVVFFIHFTSMWCLWFYWEWTFHVYYTLKYNFEPL